MNKQDILNKVKEFFSANDIPAEVVDKAEVKKFETLMLVDGTTEIVVEPALEVGAAIVINSAEGPIPAPIGADGSPAEYELQDGRVIVVAEEGVVAEVKEAAEGEPIEEPMADDQPKNEEKVKRIIERIESEKIFEKIKELEEKFNSKVEEVKFLKEENEVLTTQFNDLKTFTKETLETLLGEPKEEPITKQDPLKKFMLNNEESALDSWLKKHN